MSFTSERREDRRGEREREREDLRGKGEAVYFLSERAAAVASPPEHCVVK